MCVYAYSKKDALWADQQTDRESNRQMDRQTDRLRDGQTLSFLDAWMHLKTSE